MTFINHINLQKPSKTPLVPGVLNQPVPVDPSIPCHTAKSVSRPASSWSLVSSALLDVWSPIPPIPSEHKYYPRNVYALVVRSYRTPWFMNGGDTPLSWYPWYPTLRGSPRNWEGKSKGNNVGHRWSPVRSVRPCSTAPSRAEVGAMTRCRGRPSCPARGAGVESDGECKDVQSHWVGSKSLKPQMDPNGYPGINGHRSGKAMVSLGR